MSKSEEEDEGVPPSNSTLCGEPDVQIQPERIVQERADSPSPSGVSLKSDRSMDYPMMAFKQQDSVSKIVQERADSPSPSGVSLKSDRSMDYPMAFKQQDSISKVHQEMSEVSTASQTHLDSIFTVLEENIVIFVRNELKNFRRVLGRDYPQCQDEDVVDGEEEERSRREAFLKITQQFMRKMKEEKLADILKNRILAPVCCCKLKSNLKKKFQCLSEGMAKAGNSTLLNQVYTELHITEGGTSEVNDEHEIRQIETVSRKPDRSEITVRREDIFEASPGTDQPARTVMTKGVAGIGKTVLTQKFILDWAEGKANQDIQFIFPFTFRELNVLKEKKFSLVELVHHFFTDTKYTGICRFEEFQVVFIFDGLDEFFCWITATVLEDVLKTREGGELPKTLTEMYIHFLVVQSKLKNINCRKKGNLISYESDLTEFGIDIRAASVYSGVFTQIFKEESGLYQDKVFCFVHLSVQEFLAALHVHLTFINSGINLMAEEQPTSWLSKMLKNRYIRSEQFYQSAIDKALQSSNGHLDLFLRFLMGLSLPANQTLLSGLVKQTGSSSLISQGTIKYFKKKISENLSPEKSINLFHCLNELRDSSLVEEIQLCLSSGVLFKDKLSPAQWSALVFILLSSEVNLETFDLRKYSASEEALLRLLPVVKASTKALLTCCNLSKRSCEVLSSVISSQSSSLRELDLSNNRSAGFRTEASASWTELSYNHPGDSGVKLLSAGRDDPSWRLDTLRLDHGGSQSIRAGLRKYACELTLDPNTANRKLILSNHNTKVTVGREKQPYPDDPERFDHWKQLLCTEGLTGRCYWEVEWEGQVYVAVAYRGIRRRGEGDDCSLGMNDQSWSLKCSDEGYSGLHSNKRSSIHIPPLNRVGVYLDWPAGTLSFYRISSDKLTHIHTFYTTFTKPVYPAFRIKVGPFNSSVSLCPI
ncbi:hypothetical protein L3Q82_012936 [Scortum barcoo]|uniref:Uncharacterized protein n=1 Tax=Scortum barcoo TaxID=214431 RepID=A0ACB8W127_9TELE|nr:hypothetical protein L3Q82_012936 [Scortum barcoo]